jgi:hypothetical protein
MKLSAILGALGSGAAVLKGASTTAILVGAVYLADCRFSNRGPEALDRCWMTALPIMGLGATARGGFSIGYQTYNPALRPEDQHSGAERDEHGRFKRRQP